MNRRSFVKNSSLGLGAIPLLRKDWLMKFMQDNPYKMRMLRNDVGIFTEKGGTIGYYLSRKNIAIVDAEFPEQSKHLIDALQKDPGKPFEILINTHHHGDHTSGNISFKGIVTHVAAHSNSLINQQRVAKEQNKEDQQLYPDLTYGDSWEYRKLKENIKTHYYGPAHTNGDSIIHFPHANIAHVGDLVFNRRWAFVDRAAGASVKNWIVVLDKLQQVFDKDTLFIFGHAFDPDKVTGYKDDLKAMQDYLSRLLDFVGKQIKAGKTREEILKATAIPGVSDWQGDGIEHGLQAAYEELIEGII
ncbi:MAG: MBL fold metallo-hydrolase [Bacteroidota bacterium]|nr:MBL fold metallo-hydrolase [Bacteroidota bacterium]MDP4249531.1 MBL fold metallo-hydrolase [Bacteroidota bacterium]